MKTIKNQKGITLIALIITIIVLLILAGIAIAALAGDNGIITQARNAKNKHNEGQADEEQKLGDIHDIISEIEAENGTSSGGIKIGDYVDYEKYLTTKNYTALAAKTGDSSNQNFTTETDTKWRVLDITNGEITLVSEEPIYSNELYLEGAAGYNNAEEVLNNMCDTLYSTSKGEARSMTFEDVAKATGWDKVSQDAKYSCWRNNQGGIRKSI